MIIRIIGSRTSTHFRGFSVFFQFNCVVVIVWKKSLSACLLNLMWIVFVISRPFPPLLLFVSLCPSYVKFTGLDWIACCIPLLHRLLSFWNYPLRGQRVSGCRCRARFWNLVGSALELRDSNMMEGFFFWLTSFNFPIMSPISFSRSAVINLGNVAKAEFTIFLSAGGRVGSCAKAL